MYMSLYPSLGTAPLGTPAEALEPPGDGQLHPLWSIAIFRKPTISMIQHDTANKCQQESYHG